MLRKVILSAFIVSCFAISARAQDACGTDVVYQKLKSEHPEIGVYEQQLEMAIKQSLSTNPNRFARKTAGNDTVTYDIPIVIHIVHNYGPENVTDDAIFEAVKVWQDVYMKRNADTINVIPPFKGYIGNPRIRLHLATKDPNGNPTKGIVRHHSYMAYNAGDQAKLDQWPPNSYLNIWFVNTFSGANAGAAAYAYYPSSAAFMPYYDGIIGLSTYMNYDKAIPHEIGHVLNLQHVWGNNNNAAVACGDDEVDDTPPTKGHLPSNCSNTAAIYDVTCSANYKKTYKDVNGIDSVVDYPDTANAQNIMDYTYCQLMFTKGQVERMRISLTGATANRNNLYSTQNLTATGALNAMPDLPPVADFSVERGLGNTGYTSDRYFFGCANGTTNMIFKNQSWNDTISGVNWTFSNGATQPTSTSQLTVINKFTDPGWVTVSLTANSNAGSNTLTRQAVYIANENAIPVGGGYTQNFSNAGEMANWPMFNYFDNQFKWEAYSSAGYDDGASIRYHSYDNRTSPANRTGTPQGDYDDIYTPAFDITAINTPNRYLNFYTAGAYTGSIPSDTLEIWSSINCGNTWVKFGQLSGAALANNGQQSPDFAPTGSAQWKAQTISIPSMVISGKTFFRFRYKPGSNGNNLYFDKFSITGFTTDVEEVANSESAFKVYPNPATNGCNIVFKAGNDGNAKYEIRDMAGKVVYSKEAVYQPNALVQEHISKEALPASGIYLVTLIEANNSTTQKLVVY